MYSSLALSYCRSQISLCWHSSINNYAPIHYSNSAPWEWLWIELNHAFNVRRKENSWRTTLDVRARRRLHRPGMVGIDSGDASNQQLPVGFHRLEECMRFRPSGRVANCRHLSRSTTHIECSYVVQFTLPQQHTAYLYCII